MAGIVDLNFFHINSSIGQNSFARRVLLSLLHILLQHYSEKIVPGCDVNKTIGIFKPLKSLKKTEDQDQR